MGLQDVEKLRSTLTPTDPQFDPSLTPHCAPIDPLLIPPDDDGEVNQDALFQGNLSDQNPNAHMWRPSECAATTSRRNPQPPAEAPFSLVAIGRRSRV